MVKQPLPFLVQPPAPLICLIWFIEFGAIAVASMYAHEDNNPSHLR